VQKPLGQADIAMTRDIYSHGTAHMQRDAADRLDAAIGAAPGQAEQRA
jgi:hypothetical protein